MHEVFDSHYDLLTYILIKKDDRDFLIRLCHEIYRKDNVIGGLINTYYMPKKDMKEELGIEDINVIDDFKLVNKIINEYNLLEIRENFLLAIEGCSFVRVEDLETLYNLGLRSIIPVYNEDNQYGGGALGDIIRGLTDDGKRLLDEALRLNIIIDISHLNHKTANDVLDYLIEKRNKGFNPIVIASHSNCYSLTPRKRNITDEIIKKIGILDGIVGIIARSSFCSSEKLDNYDKAFASHIRYVSNLIGIDKVCISSDDMEYHPDKSYQEVAMYNIRNFADSVHNALINNGFNEEEAKLILVDNFKEKVLNKVKN